MLWIHWMELYCAAVQELMCGEREKTPAATGSGTVISLAAERAKRRRAAMRAL
jgi:hypothetical protein